MAKDKLPQEPHVQEAYQMGYYFFWKWQYYLRNEYLEKHKDIPKEKWPTVDSYLQSREDDQRYIYTSDQLLEGRLSDEILIQNLLTMSPRSFRNKHQMADFKFNDGILSITIDTNHIDVDSLKSHIIAQVDGALGMVSEHQNDESRVPERFQCIGSEGYWRAAVTSGLKDLNINMIARLTGLYIWDRWILSKGKRYDKYIYELVNKYDQTYFRHEPNMGHMSEEKKFAYADIAPMLIRRAKNTHASIVKNDVVPMGGSSKK